MKTKKEIIRKEAAKYIGFMNNIIDELTKAKGVMNEERKTVLTRKVKKYKRKIEELTTLWKTLP